jgi:hypothetical protein
MPVAIFNPQWSATRHENFQRNNGKPPKKANNQKKRHNNIRQRIST